MESLGSGELEIDYSLMLGPMLGLLAIGLLVLRLFPMALAFIARLAGAIGSFVAGPWTEAHFQRSLLGLAFWLSCLCWPPPWGL